MSTEPVYPPNLTDRVVTLRAFAVARAKLGELEDVARRDQLAAAMDAGDVALEVITDEGEPAVLVVIAAQPFCSIPLEPLLAGLLEDGASGVNGVA